MKWLEWKIWWSNRSLCHYGDKNHMGCETEDRQKGIIWKIRLAKGVVNSEVERRLHAAEGKPDLLKWCIIECMEMGTKMSVRRHQTAPCKYWWMAEWCTLIPTLPKSWKESKHLRNCKIHLLQLPHRFKETKHKEQVVPWHKHCSSWCCTGQEALCDTAQPESRQHNGHRKTDFIWINKFSLIYTCGAIKKNKIWSNFLSFYRCLAKGRNYLRCCAFISD